jgi:fructokinase
MPKDFRIGIDLGGSKIECILLEPGGAEIHRRRIPAPHGVYGRTVDAIRGLVLEADQIAGQVCSVGIGIPGALSRATGLVKNANSTWLIGRPFSADLEAALDRTVRIENDANCFAVSEAVDGAGQGAHVVFGVILGTGVGAGIAIDGAPLAGANAIAGEWGHNPLPWPGDDDRPGDICYCGRAGCIETFLSGPALQRAHETASGAVLDPRDIAARAEQADPSAVGTITCYEDRLARALAHVINILDPDVIVLGGGLSNISRWYRTVPEIWAPYVFSDTVETRLVPPQHGDSSGVRGAAWLWQDAPPGRPASRP